jgi:mRNA-degrading endonuclease RelE of RelBE toxin-antitoxin system
MIIKEVVLAPRFKKDFEKLDLGIQREVRDILRAIEYGDNIKGVFYRSLGRDLFGFTSVHFHDNSYRLIYRAVKNKIKIMVLMVGKRIGDKDIYDRFRELKDNRKL